MVRGIEWINRCQMQRHVRPTTTIHAHQVLALIGQTGFPNQGFVCLHLAIIEGHDNCVGPKLLGTSTCWSISCITYMCIVTLENEFIWHHPNVLLKFHQHFRLPNIQNLQFFHFISYKNILYSMIFRL